MVFGHFMWSVWCMLMLSDEDITNEKVFNYFYAEKRLQMLMQHKQQWNL
jgi:hypothetical protein